MKAKCANPAEFAIGCNSILLCETAKSVLFRVFIRFVPEATAVASPSSRVHPDGSSHSFHHLEILKTSSEPGFGGSGRDEPLSPPKHRA